MKVLIISVIAIIALSAFISSPAWAQEVGKHPFAKIVDRLQGSESVLFPGETGGPANLINANTYAFTTQSGVFFEEMSGSTFLLASPFLNNQSSALAPTGFFFRFDGGNFYKLSANSNGFVRMGAVPPGLSYVNQIPTTANSPKIAPFWDTLCYRNGGSVLSKVFGPPGSRKLVIQWSGFTIAPNQFVPCTKDGSVQLWLFEGTGVIQFVYGQDMQLSGGLGGGYSVGFQSGAGDNFAAVTTLNNTVSYTTPSDNQNSSILVGTSYIFTPQQPSAAPTAGSVSNLTQTAVQLNWTDNANNETAYLVRRTTDNVNFTVAGEVPAGSSSFTDTGLLPNTQYFYLVNAVTEGGVSSDLQLSATTQPMRNLSSNAGSSGLWSDPATWAQGIVPQSGDNVKIESGSSVILDVPASVWSLVLEPGAGAAQKNIGGAAGGSLVFDANMARSLFVRTNILISPGAFLGSAPTGTVTSHQLTVNGDLINNGTLDLSTNNNSAGADLSFTGASNNTFGGSGAVTDIRTVIIDKSTVANTLEFTMSSFSVQGSTTETPASGYLTLVNGTFKISGTFQGSHRTFQPGYQLPANISLWLNNPNYTIEGQPGSVELRGNLKVSAGNYNVGQNVDDSLILYPDTNTLIEGGVISTAGRLSVSTSILAFNYTQTNGTVITCKAGSTSADFACFDMGAGQGVAQRVLLTGGDIVIQNASTASTGPRDYRNRTTNGIYNITGTGLVFGNELTNGPSNFGAIGDLANVLVHTVAGAHTLTLLPSTTGPYRNNSRNVEIGPGGTFDIGDSAYVMQGNSFINNGKLIANKPNSVFQFFGADSMPTYSGTGVSEGIITIFAVIVPGTLTLDPGINNIRCRKIVLREGTIINANKLTLGNNDGNVSEIEMGRSAIANVGAVFDSSPVFELGTGGQNLIYVRGSPAGQWITGPEINPARTLLDLKFDSESSSSGLVTIDGGDLLVTGNLILTRGEINTGSYRLINSGSASRQFGYVSGHLERPFTAPGTYTYHVGAAGTYSPLYASVSTVNSPSALAVKAVDEVLPGLSGASSASRYWSVLKTGDLAASLAFNYTDSDINGDESLYRTWHVNGGLPVFIAGSTVNTGSNTVTSADGITGLTGDWGLGIAPVSVSGRVLTSGGTPIRNAVVTLTGGNLSGPKVFQTGNFGTYLFEDLLAGQTYTLRIGAKRYRFAQLSWQITPAGNITDLDFVANPQD